MNPTLTIVLLWLAFAATHVAFSSLTWRPRLVGMLGAAGFQGAYSVVALALFVPMVTIYVGNRHSGPMFWSIGVTPFVEILITVVMVLAMLIIVAGIITPSPVSITANQKEPVVAKGVHLVTRHSFFMAAGLFGLVHLIPNGFASDIAFFAGFPIFAVLGCVHQDQRKLVTDADRYTEFHAATPLIPFTGNQTLKGLKEISPLSYALGIGASIAIRYLHY